MIWNLFRRRTDGRAIPMDDRSLSTSDAGRILAASRNERERAKFRETARELCRLAGKPVPPILEN